MGFTLAEVKQFLRKSPEVFTIKYEEKLLQIFELFHHDVGLSHEVIANYPAVLALRSTGAQLGVRHRHRFLTELGRDQYRADKPNFVPPTALTNAITDAEFCEKYAKVPVDLFNQFLKTV